jgi:hypothetical protein
VEVHPEVNKLKVVEVVKVTNHNRLWIMNKSAFLPIVTTRKGLVDWGGGLCENWFS